MITPSELKKKRAGVIAAEMLLIEKAIIAANDAGKTSFTYHYSKNINPIDSSQIKTHLISIGYDATNKSGVDSNERYNYCVIDWIES